MRVIRKNEVGVDSISQTGSGLTQARYRADLRRGDNGGGIATEGRAGADRKPLL